MMLTTHKDRYTERFSSFMLNGGIRRLQRHGLKADGNYGKIDNLHISYDGNRITTVLEDADPVTQAGSMDYPGKKQEMAFEYNAWGALIKDESRGIESIEYDNFGNPVHIDMKGRDYTKNVYSATGVKLKTEHYTDPFIVGPPSIGGTQQSDAESMDLEAVAGIIDPGVSLLAGQEKIEYRGPVIYRNGKIDMVQFPGGYATISGTTVTFHYYTQEYLGSNRAVVNGTTGAIEQTTAYYPYGAVIPDLGTGNTGQPFKFGGKELVNANGMNVFDFGARLYYPAIQPFMNMDFYSEKYQYLSPYLYCSNNPVNAIDPDGKLVIFINGFHFGDGGSEKYWNGVEEIIKEEFNDDKTMYIDGSFGGVLNTAATRNNLDADNRKQLGFIYGALKAYNIYKSLSPDETIKIVTHSMGAAAAKGFVQALIMYAALCKKDPRILLELDLAPYQWADQSGNENVKTYTISHWLDLVAKASFMKNAINFRTHLRILNPMNEHAIISFSEDIKELIRDGKIELNVYE